MSTTIDKKVVEMRFDNKHFEKNVATTMSSLDKLKEKLNLSGASKGLEDVSSAAKKCDLSGLGSAVETISLKFSALQVMGITALTNLTNSAVNAGKRIVSALTIDPVKTGFSEYETQINAVQTILANTQSKGTTLDQVNAALDELNTYADKTIYNFTQMTRNIGTFTAAGVDLDKSVSSIKGIANLAAVSGSTSQQASTAMYQLSQALAAGRVSLMDWNSVVNAGMGGQVFQDALKRTATNMGKNVDGLIKKYGSFRESLTQGQWLTTDVLTETLSQLAGAYTESDLLAKGYSKEQAKEILDLAKTAEDAATKVKTFTQLWDTLKESAQSGWTQTWEILVGDFEEAKGMLTSISDTVGAIIGKSAEARNALLQGWKDAGGRADVIESFKNIFDAIISIVTPIKEAFREIFPPTTVDQLVKLTAKIKEITAGFKLTDTASKNLKRTFKGLFAVIDIIVSVFKTVAKVVAPLFGIFGEVGGGILGITGAIGDWLVRVRDMVKSSTLLENVLGGIVKVVGYALNGFKKLASGTKTVFSFVGDILTNFAEGVKSAMGAVTDAIDQSDLLRMLKAIWDGLKSIASGLLGAVKSLFDSLDLDLSSNSFQALFDLANALISGGIGLAIINFINSLKDTFGGVGEIVENISDIFGNLGGVLEAYQTTLRADALTKIAIAIAILSASVMLLSSVNSEKLYDSVVGLGALFAMLVGSMKALGKSMGGIKGMLKINGVIGSMTTMAIAILILSAALKNISDLDIEELGVGILGIASLMGIMVGAVKLLNKGGESTLKGATQMVIFAAAIKILASVCEDLSYLSWEELIRGGTGILAFAGILVGAAKVISKGDNKDVIKGATQMVIFAAAIKILASVCKDLAYMSWEELIRGGAGIAGIAIILVRAAKAISAGENQDVIKGALQMVIFAAAVKILASALTDMGTLSIAEVGKGLLAMAGSLAAVTLALKYMPQDMFGKSMGLIAVSAALLIIANAMSKFGGMSWEEIGKGILVLASSLGLLALALYAMNGTLVGSEALLAATLSLAILAPVLKTLGGMSWGSIAKGIIAIAAAFTVLGVAGYLLAPIVPVAIGLSKALALIGLSVVLFGVGMTALGSGLVSLAAGIAAIAASLGYMVGSLPAVIGAFLEGIFIGLANGIVALCQIITKGIPAIADAFKAIILALCDVIVECVPALVNTALKLIFAVLDSLAKYTPKIVDALFNFLVGVIDSLGNNLPRLIKSVVNLIGKLFAGVADALSSLDPEAILKGLLGIGVMVGLMAALAAVASLVPAAMLGVLGMGLVVTELALVIAAIGALAQIPGLKWLIGEGGSLMQAVGTAIGQFIGGIVGGIAQGITGSLPQIANDLASFMKNVQPFIDGARSIDNSVVSGVHNIVGVMLAITAAKVIDGLASWVTGGSSISKFATDLPILGAGLKGFSDSVAGVSAENILAAANAAKALADMTSVIPNEGGMVSWFAGENSISAFAADLPKLGEGLKGFSDAVSGIVPENIVAAANAAKSIAELTTIIPNTGGMVAWFTGDNSLAKFSKDIKKLGEALKGFSDEVAGVVPENVTAAANAAKAIAEITTIIPNEGGVAGWFSGDKSVSKFAKEMVKLGEGLKGFSDVIVGIVPENIVAAANAAKALAEMTNVIPNSGGIASWFAGDNSIAAFSDDMVLLGEGLKGFSDATVGIVPESILAAANAAKAIAEMTAIIPNEGGIVSWFSGDNSLSKFALDIAALGIGLKGFSDATTGITPESVAAGANAAKAIAEMTSFIPNQGGVVSWFTGEQSVSKFAHELPALGAGLKGFSDSIAGINAEGVASAANAAKALAEMTAIIPKEGGIKAWFTGETSISKFANQLPSLGSGLKGFSDSLVGLNPDNVTAAANAAKALGQMTDTIPDDTGKVVDFGNNLVKFGSSMKSYFANTSGISADSISATNGAIDAVKKASELNAGNISAIADSINDIGKAIKDLSRIPADATSEFSKALSEMGETSIDSLVDTFSNAESKVTESGKKIINAFIKGIEGATSKAVSACEAVAKKCASAISDASGKFTSAGKSVVEGFASGISANTYLAEAKARAMARAAADAAAAELDINSPSKVAMGIGASVPEGFAMGIDKLSKLVIQSSKDMAGGAVDGVKDSISRISDLVNTDIDSQPTIRPILDLSDIQRGASALSSLLGPDSLVGVTANVGAIGSMMARRNQNGENAELISAINRLRGDLGRVGNTYNTIGDISYDDGSAMSDAVRSIISAARIERRK